MLHSLDALPSTSRNPFVKQVEIKLEIVTISLFSFPFSLFLHLDQMYNGTLKREAENKRYSSYSQMESWGGKNYSKGCHPTSPGSDYCLVNLKSSRSEPDLYYEPTRGTLRRNQSGSRTGYKTSVTRNSLYSSYSNQQGNTSTARTNKRVPIRSPSCTSTNKQDVVYSQPVASSKQDAIYGQPHSNSK